MDVPLSFYVWYFFQNTPFMLFFIILSVVTRRELFEVLRREGFIQPIRTKSRRILVEHIVDKLSVHNIRSEVESSVLTFCSDLQKKWKACKSNSQLFVRKHPAWLAVELKIETSELTENETTTSRSGRPEKTFEEGSAKTKSAELKNYGRVTMHLNLRLLLAQVYTLSEKRMLPRQ